MISPESAKYPTQTKMIEIINESPVLKRYINNNTIQKQQVTKIEVLKQKYEISSSGIIQEELQESSLENSSGHKLLITSMMCENEFRQNTGDGYSKKKLDKITSFSDISQFVNQDLKPNLVEPLRTINIQMEFNKPSAVCSKDINILIKNLLDESKNSKKMEPTNHFRGQNSNFLSQKLKYQPSIPKNESLICTDALRLLTSKYKRSPLKQTNDNNLSTNNRSSSSKKNIENNLELFLEKLKTKKNEVKVNQQFNLNKLQQIYLKYRPKSLEPGKLELNSKKNSPRLMVEHRQDNKNADTLNLNQRRLSHVPTLKLASLSSATKKHGYQRTKAYTQRACSSKNIKFETVKNNNNNSSIRDRFCEKENNNRSFSHIKDIEKKRRGSQIWINVLRDTVKQCQYLRTNEDKNLDKKRNFENELSYQKNKIKIAQKQMNDSQQIGITNFKDSSCFKNKPNEFYKHDSLQFSSSSLTNFLKNKEKDILASKTQNSSNKILCSNSVKALKLGPQLLKDVHKIKAHYAQKKTVKAAEVDLSNTKKLEKMQQTILEQNDMIQTLMDEIKEIKRLQEQNLPVNLDKQLNIDSVSSLLKGSSSMKAMRHLGEHLTGPVGISKVNLWERRHSNFDKF